MFVLLPGKHNKLKVAWKGSHEVLEKWNECNYKIEVGNKAKTYHTNLLKQYIQWTAEEQENGEEPCIAVVIEDTEEEEEETEWWVSHIPMLPLERKEGPKNVHYGTKLNAKQLDQGQRICQSHKSSDRFTTQDELGGMRTRQGGRFWVFCEKRIVWFSGRI